MNANTHANQAAYLMAEHLVSGLLGLRDVDADLSATHLSAIKVGDGSLERNSQHIEKETREHSRQHRCGDTCRLTCNSGLAL